MFIINTCDVKTQLSFEWFRLESNIESVQKVSVHPMITIQKVTRNVQSVPHQSPDIY